MNLCGWIYEKKNQDKAILTNFSDILKQSFKIFSFIKSICAIAVVYK